MKYQIIGFVAPQVLVRYSTDDDLLYEDLWVRIDPDDAGNIPAGDALSQYIMLFAPELPRPDPTASYDWSGIQQLVQPIQQQDPQVTKFVELVS